ncbi:MAG: hypothetical protein AAGI30_11620 [Planctomycetota bacterium]
MTFIDGLGNADSMPTLGAALGFSASRQPIIADNIANLTTPNYRPKDVSIGDFQETLRGAIRERRERWGGMRGSLNIRRTNEVSQDDSGALHLTPRETGRNVLFHDRNDRDLERSMQDLAENVAYFRVMTDLMRSRVRMLNSAIREQVA